MNGEITIRPLGLARLASSPIMGLEVLGKQRVLGIPLPSTILGLLGATLRVRLSEEEVRNAPLLGIECLADALSKGNRERVIVEGPLIRVKPRIGDPCIAIPIFAKRGIKLVKLSIGLLKEIREKQAIPEDAVVGRSVPRVETGIALRDSLEGTWQKIVALGFTFRRGFVEYVDRTGEKLTVEFIYKLNMKFNVKHGLVRLGGEGRQALLTSSPGKLPGEFADRVTNPVKAEPGVYIVLNYWPLIPKDGNILYLEKGKVLGLEFFENPSEDVIGVPKIVKPRAEREPPGKRVVRLGLGFSEVARCRRPQILALPSGTLIRIKHSFNEVRDKLPEIYRGLLRAGYASLLKIASCNSR